jgi:hypothetical protein
MNWNNYIREVLGSNYDQDTWYYMEWFQFFLTPSRLRDNTVYRSRQRPLCSPIERANLIQWLRLALSKGPNWLGVLPPPWPEDGNRFSFRNVVFFNFLEYWTMDKVQKLSNSECYTPSSGPTRIYLIESSGRYEASIRIFNWRKKCPVIPIWIYSG